MDGGSSCFIGAWSVLKTEWLGDWGRLSEECDCWKNRTGCNGVNGGLKTGGCCSGLVKCWGTGPKEAVFEKRLGGGRGEGCSDENDDE